MGLEALSTEDLLALKSGDLSKVSTAGLQALTGGAPPAPMSVVDKLKNAVMNGNRPISPMNSIMRMGEPGINKINDLISEGGYKVGEDVAEATGSPLAGAAANTAVQAVPMAVGGKVGEVIGSAGRPLGRSLMRMAVKPSHSLDPAKADRAIETMLTADVGNIVPGANVTRGGIGEINTKLGKLGAEEAKLLSQNAGQTVNKFDVANVGNNSADIFGNQVNPVSDRAAIAAALEEFLTKNPKVPSRTPAQVIPSQTIQSPVLNANGQPFTQTIPGRTIPASGSDEIPIQIANELKKGTYKVLGDKAYNGELGSASTSVQQDLARGLKEMIEGKVPAIAPINAERSDLINAVKAAISRDATAANKDPLGLGFIAANPKAALAFMANRSELVKSQLARLLFSGGRPVGTGLGITAGGVFGNRSED